jgi:hypothetical protein
MSEPANEHERWVASLFSRSLAAPLLFHPKLFGKDAHQFADMVFARGDTVLIFEAAEQVSIRDDAAFNARKAIKKSQHNTRKFSGQLNRWRSGHPIEGKNKFGQFNIPYSTDLAVGLLSIVRGPAAFGCRHDDIAKDLNVPLCVTLPDAAIEWMCNTGCTGVDFVNVAQRLPNEPTRLSQDEIIASMSAGISDSWKESGVGNLWPNGPDSDYRRIAKAILALHDRFFSTNDVLIEPRSLKSFSLSADLSICELHFLFAAIKSAAIASKSTRGSLNETIRLADVNFAVSTIPDFEQQLLEQAGDFADAHLATEGGTYGPHILVIADPFSTAQDAKSAYEWMKSFIAGRQNAGYLIVAYTIEMAEKTGAIPTFGLATVGFPPIGTRERMYHLLRGR